MPPHLPHRRRGLPVTGGRYLDNEEYGIFPCCSEDGLIDHNSGGGGDDATIYVGVDDNVDVKKNTLSDAVIGIELENTTNSRVRGNKPTGKVNGILVVVLPGLPTISSDHHLIEHNVIRANNLPNPFPPPPPLFDDLQLLPSGSGILNVGGDQVTMRNNVITKNDSFGIGIVENPFGFGPPDDNRVLTNTCCTTAQVPMCVPPSAATSSTTKRHGQLLRRQRLRDGCAAGDRLRFRLPVIPA